MRRHLQRRVLNRMKRSVVNVEVFDVDLRLRRKSRRLGGARKHLLGLFVAHAFRPVRALRTLRCAGFTLDAHDRQANRKCRPAAEHRFGRDCTAVRIDDALDDCKSQPGAAAAARARPIDDVETLEDMRQIAIRNSFARVAHAQDRIAVARIQLDPNATAATRMAQRVVNEVNEDLREAIGIGFDPTGRSAASSSETPLFDACCSNDATIGRATSSRSTSRSTSLSCPDSARACSSNCPTSAVKRSTCASACGTNKIARLLFGCFEHRLEHQLDRRERRPQLVGNVREKLFARAVEPNESGLVVGEDDDAAGIRRRSR